MSFNVQVEEVFHEPPCALWHNFSFLLSNVQLLICSGAQPFKSTCIQFHVRMCSGWMRTSMGTELNRMVTSGFWKIRLFSPRAENTRPL